MPGMIQIANPLNLLYFYYYRDSPANFNATRIESREHSCAGKDQMLVNPIISERSGHRFQGVNPNLLAVVPYKSDPALYWR